MSGMSRLSVPDRLAALAGALAAVASVIGFIPGVYRDSPVLVVQSNGQDVATLLVVLPVLAAGLVASARGAIAGRIVVLGALAYLLYTYAVYAFIARLGSATILHIAIVGLSAWTLLLSVMTAGYLPATDAIATTVSGLRRRATAAFLFVIAAFFAFAWLSQIASAAITGIHPESLTDAGLPTNPIFTLDLAFVLPLCVLAGWGLLGRRLESYLLAAVMLVFAPLISIGVLSITLIAVMNGQQLAPFDAVLTVVFIVLTVIGVTLAWLTLAPTRTREAPLPAKPVLGTN